MVFGFRPFRMAFNSLLRLRWFRKFTSMVILIYGYIHNTRISLWRALDCRLRLPWKNGRQDIMLAAESSFQENRFV
jgi:hypothetical protein